MISKKETKKEGNKVAYISNSLIFHIGKKPFRIFKPKKTKPNSPDYALLDLTEDKRLSGLWEREQGHFYGDIVNNYGKEKFCIRFLDKTTVETSSLERALELSGYISTRNNFDTLESQMRASQVQKKGGFE